MNATTLNVRINKETKDQAQKVVEKLGLDLSSAVKLFLNKVIITESIPFELRTVNGYTQGFEARLLKEVKGIEKNGKRYKNVESAIRELKR